MQCKRCGVNRLITGVKVVQDDDGDLLELHTNCPDCGALHVIVVNTSDFVLEDKE